jgi:uncharacterized protein (DUF2147 family)
MRNVIALPALFAILIAASPSVAAQDITGTWNRGDGNARVSITRCGQAYCATNIWIRDSSSGEKVGHLLVMNVKSHDNKMFAGTAYDPQRKINLSATVSVSGDQMTTNGCVLAGMLCKNMSWTRVK